MKQVAMFEQNQSEADAAVARRRALEAEITSYVLACHFPLRYRMLMLASTFDS